MQVWAKERQARMLSGLSWQMNDLTTTLRIRGARTNADLLNNERKAKKPIAAGEGEVRPLNALG